MCLQVQADLVKAGLARSSQFVGDRLMRNNQQQQRTQRGCWAMRAVSSLIGIGTCMVDMRP
jgi:hypothetical protein